MDSLLADETPTLLAGVSDTEARSIKTDVLSLFDEYDVELTPIPPEVVEGKEDLLGSPTYALEFEGCTYAVGFVVCLHFGRDDNELSFFIQEQSGETDDDDEYGLKNSVGWSLDYDGNGRWHYNLHFQNFDGPRPDILSRLEGHHDMATLLRNALTFVADLRSKANGAA